MFVPVDKFLDLIFVHDSRILPGDEFIYHAGSGQSGIHAVNLDIGFFVCQNLDESGQCSFGRAILNPPGIFDVFVDSRGENDDIPPRFAEFRKELLTLRLSASFRVTRLRIDPYQQHRREEVDIVGVQQLLGAHFVHPLDLSHDARCTHERVQTAHEFEHDIQCTSSSLI